MSDEQLARIEAQVTRLVAGRDELRTGQDELRAGLAELRGGQDELRAGLAELRGGQDELRAGQLLILKRLDKVEIRQEGLIDDVKGLAEGQAALRIEMQRGFTDVREEIGRRVDPLEAAVRDLRG